MKYNFDQIIPREGTFCDKYDHREQLFGRADVLPLWVADMDFATPEPILDAIRKRMEHPILGYTFRSESYFQSIQNWVQKRNGWTIEANWIDFVPGVVPGIGFALQALTSEGDGVVIQPPVYHPFARQIKRNGRTVVNNPMREVNGKWEIDFEDLDRKLSTAKAFLISNPHNPSGRVYTRKELTRIGQLCMKHDVIMLSDEIHSDLIFSPLHHIHIAALDPSFAERTVTFIAPSKTFNLAGLSTAVAITSNPTLRRRLQTELEKINALQGNIFGTISLEAAYTHGEEWLEELKQYLQGNIDYVMEFLHQHLPSISCRPPEGTYLMWLDFRSWPIAGEELQRFLIQEAGIAMNEGSMFGAEGLGWMRLNVATQRSILEQAMKQLLEAYNRLPK